MNHKYTFLTMTINIKIRDAQKMNYFCEQKNTERVGFEPTNSNLLNDFESFAFDHSATSPVLLVWIKKIRISQFI